MIDKKIGPHEAQIRALRESRAWQQEQQARKSKKAKAAPIKPTRHNTGKGRRK